MKNFNRSLVSILAMLLCVCLLAACGDGQPKETVESTTDAVENTTSGEETAKDPDTDGEKTTAIEDTTSVEETTAAPDYDAYDIITIAEALEKCGEPGNLTEERYYIRGTVVSISNPQYGAMTIADETGEISVYGTYSADGEICYADMEKKPYKGDTVLLHCTLQNYNGTKEVKNARLIAFEKAKVEVDEKEYKSMTVAEAREAAAGTKAKVEGVVAQITYTNGMKPMGVYLVDGTQSIYVYDGDLAGRVKIGNTVTVLGTKAYWILDTEVNNAEKFGYKGCNQLEDVTLVEIDETVKEFDKSWIETSTVKAIMDTPVTEDITSTVYKVNALVEKRDGKGFVNYYFFDLDGKTGTYTYTQCNGSDFSWLDKFDGKICTVYLSALNAKSTASDCFFRFVPVAVIDEGFKFDTKNAAQHAVEYYGLTRFNASYTGDPAAEMITSVSSELLGFENAKLSYASSDSAVVSFKEEGGKTVFHCGKTGTATVTVTGSYNGTTYSAKLEISVEGNASFDTVSVKEAQETAVGETVTVRGIVGPSVVNKSGFYLFDETGMIAVIVKDAAVFDEIEIGHEIVLTGMRDCYKDKDKTHAGQLCITNAEVVANYYGNTDYPETAFVTGKTLADVYALNVNEDHTTEVYVVKATVSIVETPYYSTISLTDGSTKLSLYCSGAGQYAFLKPYAGQEVTLEIAPCNWNNKTYYVGCVLAVHTADGKVLNTLNFNN